MRHGLSQRKLNRTSAHRKAMLRNMAVSLFEHEQIKTTLPKAKELRRYAEPFITLAKDASVANRRLAFNRLRDRDTVGRLFDDLGVRFKDRPGGYIRILKCGYRAGDKAPMAYVQLVEMKEVEAEVAAEAAPASAPVSDEKSATAEKADNTSGEKDTKKTAKEEPKTETKAKAEEKPAKKAAAKKDDTKAKAKKDDKADKKTEDKADK